MSSEAEIALVWQPGDVIVDLYEVRDWMLTGAPPRHFPSGVDPIAVVLRDAAVPIRQRVPSIPRRLAAVIDEALIDNPRIFITTADELKRALQDAL